MLDGLPVGPIVLASSPWVLLALVGYLIVTGRLSTPREVARMEKEIEYLRDTLRTSEQARVEALSQGQQMLNSLETIENVVRALPAPPTYRHRR